MKKKISIYDIAKYINVSPATVSYVINGVHKVSEETKQKVLAAIEELGYVPDHNARSLSTGKSHLIGLFLPLDDASIAFLQNPFYVEFIGGLEQGIANYDYDIVIGYQKNQNNFKDWARSRGLDGIVMLGTYPKNVYEDIKKLNIPVVLTDIYEEYADEFHNVRINDEKGMFLATKHLIEKGHKNIGFVGARNFSLVDKNRYHGYVKAMKEYNLTIDESNLYDCFATFDDGYAIADNIMKNKELTAIVCSADIIAIGIMKRYKELGKDLPNDLSIVGFDDISDAKYIYPGITTIRQDIGQKGKMAARIIVDNLENEVNTKTVITLEPILIERESVKSIK